MYTNRYGNRKAKELNLERIFKKQAQLQPPTSSRSTQHQHHTECHPTWTTLSPQQLPHTHIICTFNQLQKLCLPQQCVFLTKYLFVPD